MNDEKRGACGNANGSGWNFRPSGEVVKKSCFREIHQDVMPCTTSSQAEPRESSTPKTPL